MPLCAKPFFAPCVTGFRKCLKTRRRRLPSPLHNHLLFELHFPLPLCPPIRNRCPPHLPSTPPLQLLPKLSSYMVKRPQARALTHILVPRESPLTPLQPLAAPILQFGADQLTFRPRNPPRPRRPRHLFHHRKLQPKTLRRLLKTNEATARRALWPDKTSHLVIFTVKNITLTVVFLVSLLLFFHFLAMST